MKCLIACTLLLVASSATAQDINIDFSATPADVPPASFGAVGQPGTWNGIAPVPGGPAVPVVDVNGAPTGVTVSIPKFGSTVSPTFKLIDPSLPLDVTALLEDGISAGDLPESLTIAGLRPGEYDLVLYGYVPTHFSWETWFLAPGGQQITQTFPWPGDFQLGMTHVRVRQAFATGFPVFWANPTGLGAGEFGWFSGMQIERVWKPLGGGTTGVNGAPKLAMSGTLKPGTPLGLSLADGAPNAFSIVFVNVNSMPMPFFGCMLHAFPVSAQVALSTDPSGAFSGSATFPGAPSDTPFTFQVGIADPSVPVYGVALSNAVVGRSF
jgi:hypothetical protein